MTEEQIKQKAEESFKEVGFVNGLPNGTIRRT